jgi:hypothetical protein
MFDPEITLHGKCRCGEPIVFTAYLMKAYMDPRYDKPCYTSDLREGQVEVPPEKALYSYDMDCPKCGKNIEGVLGPK